MPQLRQVSTLGLKDPDGIVNNVDLEAGSEDPAYVR
jgi:hypothetical protein